ncbi:MAG: hypothetical protein BWK76_12495 [Desulfobulbaceae bacterium A2]|nr:MAG: hypothetical protein BWK76_12495 [Desulfobulbaceae bacterium A2]
MQGAQIIRNEAYSRYVAMTKDAAQRGSWRLLQRHHITDRRERLPLHVGIRHLGGFDGNGE